MKFKKFFKWILRVFLFFLIIGIGVFFYFFNPIVWSKEKYYAQEFDKITQQKPVLTQTELDKILNSFPQVTYNQLDTAYLSYTKYKNAPFKSFVQNRTFYVIKGKDIFRFLVGKHRVKDFLAKDQYYFDNLNDLDENRKQYFLIDKQVLFKLLALQQALKKGGYDETAFWVGSVHRHPLVNQEVGGASVSFHIQGKAIDINILDIDKNGVPSTTADKKIVLDLLENHIVGKTGGVGRYPLTPTVHFDVRGYFARWDRQ